MKDFETNSVLTVLADDYYDEDDYMRDYKNYERFLGEVKE